MLVLQHLLIGECSFLFFYFFFCSLAHIQFCFTWLQVTDELILFLHSLQYLEGHLIIIFPIIFLFLFKRSTVFDFYIGPCFFMGSVLVLDGLRSSVQAFALVYVIRG
jgi:hypothetical protein